jgi:phage shock protein PspC (stress-responsive transcriptional regulator)
MIVVCALFLVTLTMSRSGLLGIFFLFISFLLYFWKSNYKSIAYVIFFCLTFFAILIFNADVLVNTVLVQSYIDRAANTSLEEQADIRGYTRIINYSEYLLFGAGQGLDSRFGLDVEIHSTWAAFLFYYGVFGFSLFMYLIIKIFINLNIKQKLLFLAPLMYSFSTFGARTIIFWIFVAFFYYAAYYVNKDRVKGL